MSEAQSWQQRLLQQSGLAESPQSTALQDWQQQQRQLLLEQGFPTRRHEDWRYADLTSLMRHNYVFSPTRAYSCPDRLKDLPKALSFVFINGAFQAHLSSVVSEVIASPTQQTLLDPRLNDHWYTLVAAQPSDNPFTQLNASLLSDGLYLSVPRGYQLEPMIHLLYLVTEEAEEASMQHPRHVLHLAEQANATVLEEYIGLSDKPYFNNVVTHVHLESGAKLLHVKRQREGSNAYHIAETLADLAKDAQWQTFNISMGAHLSRDGLVVNLNDCGAACQSYGLAQVAQSQYNDTHSLILHRASHSASQQYYKGLYGDFARGVFNGKLLVQPNAMQVQAHQTNKNILLSAAAEVNTKPELEIYADDVQCSHGATIGQLDEAALFYCQSRGLSQTAARELLIEAFAAEIYALIPDTELLNHVRGSVVQEASDVVSA